MDSINEIIELEWEMFQKVNNIGGVASCQNNFLTFKAMRLSQFLSWNKKLLESYYNDLIYAKNNNRNLIEEKYARMMLYTHKEEYDKISYMLSPVTEEQTKLVDNISYVFKGWEKSFINIYPNVSKHSRLSSKHTSTIIYLKGELLTYSISTLKCMQSYINTLVEKDINLIKEINLHTVKFYGYNSLEEAEKTIGIRG